MKIAIIKQPLLDNVGGVLQNWALQQVLIEMGHQPITIDYLYQTTCKKYFENLLKVSALRIMGRPFYVNPKFVRSRRNADFDSFVKNNIVKTPVVHSYSPSLLKKYDIDAVIVGSDQVWRPRYNYETLPEMFLSFVKSSSIVRVGYAVSFGSNQWEYSEEQSYYQKSKAGQKFRKRAGIEPVIGHLKSDHRMMRNYLKGTLGDAINTLMAAAAYNLRHWMDKNASFLFVSWWLMVVKRLESAIFGNENKSACLCANLATLA